LPPTPVADPSYRLYVANAGNNSITVYGAFASGHAAPIATIIGSNTQLSGPGQLSEDASGNLYVANRGTSSILVFAHGANGNVAPIRVIAGPLTGLSYLGAAMFDKPTGQIIAVAELPPDGESELLRFAPDATGNEAPLAASQPNLDPTNEIASDSAGKNIIEAGGAVCCIWWAAGVETFKKAFPNGASLGWIYQVNSFPDSGIANDPTTKTYLVSGSDGAEQGIFRLDDDTDGHGANDGVPPNFTPAVVSVITSDTCGSQLALGDDRNIYVAHSTAYPGSCASDAVYVYEHDASGNAAPIRVLTGPATQLDQPAGIYEGQ